jgi:cell division protein FtsB
VYLGHFVDNQKLPLPQPTIAVPSDDSKKTQDEIEILKKEIEKLHKELQRIHAQKQVRVSLAQPEELAGTGK